MSVRFSGRAISTRAGLVLAGLGVSFLIGEGAARWLLPEPERGNLTPVPREIRRPSEDPRLPYLLRPGAVVEHPFPSDPRGYFGPALSVTYRINSLGFRGPETTWHKPAGQRRVIVLGDSFTFGTGVAEGDTFSSGLARRLAARRGAESFEVLNLGVMGYDSQHEVALLETVGLELEPDLVLIVFFLNDARGGGSHALFNDRTARQDLPWWRRSSTLLDRLHWVAARQRRVEKLAEAYRDSFADDSPTWRRARRALLRARELSEGADARLVLVLFPVLWQLSGDYPFADVHQAVTTFAEASGIRVLDLRPAFNGHDGPELWVHPTNQHPNEAAHDLVAEALFGYLASEGLLEKP